MATETDLPRSARPSMWLRGAALFAIAAWLGGLTFYGCIVVPSATHVLGSHRAAGFITRVVTLWMNWIGVASLLVLLAHWSAARFAPTRWATTAWRAWLTMVVVQLSMFVLHPILDGHLDPLIQHVDDPDTFYWLHRIYLWSAGLLWIAGVVHATAMLRMWHSIDSARD